MQQFPGYSPEFSSGSSLTSAQTASYLRRVYTLFTTAIIASAAGSLFALYAGADVAGVTVQLRNGTVATLSPLVALLSSGWIVSIVSLLLLFGVFTAASWVRNKPVINVVALHGAAFFAGVVIAPTLFFAQLRASGGETFSPSPVRDAFLLASAAFTGLTAYALITKKDFSFLRGFLTMGFFVVLGGLILNMFVGSSIVGLAIASAGVLLFSAYILYDTSRILREAHEESPAGVALTLFLNFFNLFLMLLRILGGKRD